MEELQASLERERIIANLKHTLTMINGDSQEPDMSCIKDVSTENIKMMHQISQCLIPVRNFKEIVRNLVMPGNTRKRMIHRARGLNLTYN